MPFQVSRISKDFKYCFFASDRQAGRILKLSRSHHWWQARISALSRGSVRRRDWLLRLRSLGDWSRASRCVLTILNLGTVRQIQDTEKRVLSRKTERRGWRKWEGGLAKMWRVWRKCNICGENVKNAGEKKIYYPRNELYPKTGPFCTQWLNLLIKGIYAFELIKAWFYSEI